MYLYLLSGPHSFLGRVDSRTRVRPGQKMEVALNMAHMHIFDRVTERAYL
jgi:hypothetical protein